MKKLEKLYTPEMQEAARIAADTTTGKEDFWAAFAKAIPRKRPALVEPRKIRDT